MPRKPIGTINGREVMTETRHYGGGQFYTWAYWQDENGEWVSLGDPYPASCFPKRILTKEIPHPGECYLPR